MRACRGGDRSQVRIRQLSSAGAQSEIAELSPLLAGISRQMPYEVPAGYFESTSEGLADLTASEDSLILSFIEKEMPFEVPRGYFQDLPAEIMDKIQGSRGKVVSVGRGKWARLAVAAVMTGIITFSGIFYFSGKNNTSINPKEPVAQQLKNVSTHDLEEFIKSTDANSSTAAIASNKPEVKEVKQMLQHVSDGRI